jgi:hypothetical protein
MTRAHVWPAITPKPAMQVRGWSLCGSVPPIRYASRAQRNPILPAELSGVFPIRADTRYRRQ